MGERRTLAALALAALLVAPALADECTDYRAAVGKFVRSGTQFLLAQAARDSAEEAWLRKEVARATDAYNYEEYLDQRKRHQESEIELQYRLDLLQHRHRHPRTLEAAARMTAIAQSPCRHVGRCGSTQGRRERSTSACA